MNRIGRLLLLVVTIATTQTEAHSLVKADELRLYISCNTACDMLYIKNELSFARFVQDRFDANIFILITGLSTASGGAEVTLMFHGQQEFATMNDTVRFYRYVTESNDEYRKKMVQSLKVGLVRYLSRTSLINTISINIPLNRTLDTTFNKQVADNWNYWTFRVSAWGSYSANDFTSSNNLNGSAGASRVTDKLKIAFGGSASYSNQMYNYDDEKTTVENEGYNGNTTIVASVNKHWSLGGFASVDHSTYSNYRRAYALNPAIEFSLYPYEESNTKSITLFYQVGPSFRTYIDTSFYDQLDEVVYNQNLSLNAGTIQKWGQMWMSVGLSDYLNSFEKNDEIIKGFEVRSLSINGGVDLKLIKGLSVGVNGYANFNKGVNPNLPAKSFTRDDLLTNARAVATQQSYRLNVGISYRFGSIYSNIVNPRFRGAGT